MLDIIKISKIIMVSNISFLKDVKISKNKMRHNTFEFLRITDSHHRSHRYLYLLLRESSSSSSSWRFKHTVPLKMDSDRTKCDLECKFEILC
jgi:hypothetical protein